MREYFSRDDARVGIVLEHTLRVVIPYSILTGLSIGAVIRMRRERVRVDWNAESYACLLLIAGVCSQPFLDSPTTCFRVKRGWVRWVSLRQSGF